MAAVSTNDFESRFLVDNHPAVCRQVFKVHGTFPVHVQVGPHRASPVNDAIIADHVTAHPVVVQIARIGGNGHYRQIVVPILIYIRARDDAARQETVGKEAQTQYGGLRDAEPSVPAGLSILQCRCAAVKGIAQGGAGRNVHTHVETTGKQPGITIHQRKVQHGFRIMPGIGGSRCRQSAIAPFVPLQIHSGIAASGNGCGISYAKVHILSVCRQIQRAAVPVQLESHLPCRIRPEIAVGSVVVEEDASVCSGRQDPTIRELVLCRHTRLVADVPSVQRDVLAGRVIKFNPPAIVVGMVNGLVNVRHADFRDYG